MEAWDFISTDGTWAVEEKKIIVNIENMYTYMEYQIIILKSVAKCVNV